LRPLHKARRKSWCPRKRSIAPPRFNQKICTR
jgi:hypothetical protein